MPAVLHQLKLLPCDSLSLHLWEVFLAWEDTLAVYTLMPLLSILVIYSSGRQDSDMLSGWLKYCFIYTTFTVPS